LKLNASSNRHELKSKVVEPLKSYRMKYYKIKFNGNLAELCEFKVGVRKMFTRDHGGHHGREHEEQLIEEEQSGVVIDSISVIADLPVEQSH
jgi:hypothetical protein